MPICPRCNSQVSVQANTCNSCGSPLWTNLYDDDEIDMPKDEKICPSCNTSNDANWVFCSYCGASLANVVIKVARVAAKQKPLDALDSMPTRQKPINNISENRIPVNDLFNIAEEPRPTKPVAESLEELVFCSVCGQANPKDIEICLSCQNALSKTLAMGSPVSHPKLVLMKDSGESEIYDITGSEFVIGRNQGDVTFPQDNYMSSYHARIVCRDKKFFLIDEQSKNGVYKRIKEELVLKNGTIILVGRQIFRFEQ